jgi:hypothetical protein
MAANEIQATAPLQSTPAAAMINLIVGAYASQAICVTARLGVADVLANGPQPVEEIARQVGTYAFPLYRVLRAVADVGVVAELDCRHFALTPLGEILRSDVPGSLRAWATLIGMPFWHRSWSELHEALQAAESPFARANGAALFSYLAENPDDANVFDVGMASMYTYINVIGTYDLSAFHTIVDIGGGRGTVLAGVLTAHPHLRGVLFDTPVEVVGAEDELARAGVSDRCRVLGGDIFSSVPEGGDVYLLSGMIHNASDDEAVKIFSTCRAAMAEDGRLLIAETVVPDGSQPSVAKFMDLQMLVLTDNGRFRTESELGSLLDQAGFRLVRNVPSSPLVSLLEAAPRARSLIGLGIPGFQRLARAVHRPEQVGQISWADRGHLPHWLARGLGPLQFGVEGAVLDGRADVKHAYVDAPASDLGLQRLQVVALGGLCRTGAAHIRQPLHGAAALRGQYGAVALLEHVRQELLHECQHRVEDQRHEVLSALGSQPCRRDEPAVWGGRVVKGVGMAGRGANPLGQPGRCIGVGQVGCYDMRGSPGIGQFLGQQVKRLLAAPHQGDGVSLVRVTTGDGPAEAGPGTEYSDGIRHQEWLR